MSCHIKALECLEEAMKLQNDDPELLNIPQSIITNARVCNMLGEIAKRK